MTYRKRRECLLFPIPLLLILPPPLPPAAAAPLRVALRSSSCRVLVPFREAGRCVALRCGTKEKPSASPTFAFVHDGGSRFS